MIDRTHKSLYVFPASGLVKVGISSEPDTRWSILKKQFRDLEAPAFVSERLAYPFRAEAVAHKRLAAFCAPERGKEWFRCDARSAITVASEVAAKHARMYPARIEPAPEAVAMKMKPDKTAWIIPKELSEADLRRIVAMTVEEVLARRPVPTAVTLKEAAEMLGLSPNTARKLKLPRNSCGLIPYEEVLKARN